jgi:hypothetical protein
VAVDTSQAYKDLKPPLSIPLTFAEIALYAGVILLLAAVAYGVYRHLKKRKTGIEAPAYTAPPRPAHVIALEELRKLKDKKLWQHGQIKQYYTEASEIIRRYVENRFHIMALEQTTDEITIGLQRTGIGQAACGQVETLLRLADLVKFAKYTPGITEHEQTMTMAFDIVESTKPVETRAAVTQKEAAAHVGS